VALPSRSVIAGASECGNTCTIAHPRSQRPLRARKPILHRRARSRRSELPPTAASGLRTTAQSPAARCERSELGDDGEVEVDRLGERYTRCSAWLSRKVQLALRTGERDGTGAAPRSQAEPALCVQVGELGVRRTPTLSHRGAPLDAEPGETEVHETGAAAQQTADLGTAAMLIAVGPADLIAARPRWGDGAHRRRPASCAPSGAQHRTGPPEPGSTGSSTYAVTSVATEPHQPARARPTATPQGARPHRSHRSSPVAHPNHRDFSRRPRSEMVSE
jgi:hypothetical protein